MKQVIISKGLCVILLMLGAVLPIVTFAQDPGMDPDVPIDGGLSALIVAGIGYGIKKVRDERIKKRDTGV